ncbi:MAG: tyrosine-type recombinase/integrase [Eubacterium sp.]|nr:tyrosine-type recombinase/integrase [Eubacterium sp.]
MNTAQPIKNPEELKHFKNYYKEVKPNTRNYVLLTIGLNTALRISDLLSLQWQQVYDFSKQSFRSHICLVEQKTGKYSQIYMNTNILQALIPYKEFLEREEYIVPEQYLLLSQRKFPLSRSQAWRIVKVAAKDCDIPGVISPHSLRKTFGYHACKQGVQPTLLMDVFNHSSFEVTRRYLGIEQDDRDEVFRNICI